MINILFCGNDKVFDGVLTTSLSIFKRTKTQEPFCFYVYTMDITRVDPKYKPINDAQIAFFEKIIKKYNSENQVIKIDVGEVYDKEFRSSPNESAYCSPYTLLRLLADEIPGMPDKLLYLDVDLLFNRDITELYNQDVEGFEYAAARDHYGKYLINRNYINAGVILFNLKECKRTGLLKKARELIRTKKLMFADQDAIYYSTTKKKMLPQKFNDQKFLHNHTVVRHFSKRLFWLPYPHTDNIKQWNVTEVHKTFKYYQFDDILFEYLYYKKLFEESFKEKKMLTTNNTKINLFFACDDNYVPFMAVTISSIQKYMSPENNYRVIVMHAGNISLENQEKLTLKYTKPNFEIKFHDITNEVERIAELLHTRDYYSKATYYRLLIPNLYPQMDKALYIDSDIVVLDDIANLFNTDLGENYVGAIHDGAVETVPPFQEYVCNVIGCEKQEDYFNAGVLLMNLKKMREVDFENKFLSLLSRVKFDVAQDQDYLNAICCNKVKHIDAGWNTMPIESLEIDPNDVKLIHYNLSFKPWHKDGILYGDIFWDHAKDVDYYNIILNIKRNYPKEKIEKADNETNNLIANAKQQAENHVRNSEIRKIIIEIMKN